LNNDELLGRILALETFVNAITTSAPQEFMDAVSGEFERLIFSRQSSLAGNNQDRPDLCESFARSAAALSAHHVAEIPGSCSEIETSKTLL
jgi:hypothetical protein